MFETLKTRLRRGMRSFLNIAEPATSGPMTVRPAMSLEMNQALHKILYRCDPAETVQIFEQIKNCDGIDVGAFWSTVPRGKSKVRKIRSDVYPVVIDTYASICQTAYNDPEIEEDYAETYEAIFKEEQEGSRLVKTAVQQALIFGDAALKISIDTERSDTAADCLIIEVVGGEYFDPVYDRGRLKKIIFYTRFKEGDNHYTLHEIYERGSISYKLYKGDKQVQMDETERTRDLQDIEFAGDFIAATVFKIWESSRFEGRGKSLFDGKISLLDGVDECLSQNIDNLRRGRIRTYIPDSLLARDRDGRLMNPSGFEDYFIAVAGSYSETGSKIETVQPVIQYEAYINSYITMLDAVLTGVISPSTLGIDLKKLSIDNATALRERERITNFRKSEICDQLAIALEEFIDKALKMYENLTGGLVVDHEVLVLFDEYNSDQASKLQLARMAMPSADLMTWRQVVDIVADDRSEEEREELAEQLAKQNSRDTVMDFPQLFPTDYDKHEDEEEDAAAPETALQASTRPDASDTVNE